MNNVINLREAANKKELEERYKEQLIRMFVMHTDVNDWDVVTEE